ncbi:MAG: HAD family hydrolase, partial [Clostridia bacterium]|nr:HAD family hydrolase [Clostridia bacterium]
MTYLFDFDGTLVDSMGVFAQTMLALLEEHRIPYGADMVKRITPLGYGGTADYFISLGLPMERGELIDKMIGNAREAYVHRIEAKEGVLTALRALHARGDSLNVLTASPHEALDPCLKRIGAFDLFDN